MKAARDALARAEAAVDLAATTVEKLPEEACPVCGNRMEDARLVTVSMCANAPGDQMRPRPVVLPYVGPPIQCPCARRRPGYEITVCKACRNAFLTALGQWLEGHYS